MPKPFSILFLILLSASFVFPQNAEDELRSRTWYCSCNFNSDGFSLSADNASHPEHEVTFSGTGKLLIRSTKKRNVDSSYTYLFRKKTLILRSDLKDSVKTLNYTVKKDPGKKAYGFAMKYSSRYIHKKGNEAIVMNKFVLMNGKKRKVIQEGEEITVFSQYKALHNDSINRAVWGIFVGYVADTLLIESDQYVEHNYYKKYPDTLHYIAPLLLDTTVRVKVPLKYITGIYNQREPISSISSNATLIGMAVGFAGIAASVTAGDGSSSGVFAQIGVFSFLTIPVSLSVNMLASKQKFQLNSTRKPKKNWTIERHMPNTIITQRKSTPK